jgi:zinc/manganese transport system substrate-binding protein
MYQPTPKDIEAFKEAKLVVVHGLYFDDWMKKLIKSSGYKIPVVVVSRKVKPIVLSEEASQSDGHDHGGIDPHAWQDIGNTLIYVDNIKQALSIVDPAHKKDYEANAQAYSEQLSNLDREIKEQMSVIPKEKRRILTAHNAFAYLGRRYELTMIALQGVNPHSEASAAQIADIIRQAKAAKVYAMFLENVSDDRALKQISKESGVKIGGTLYSDALSKPTGPAKTYIDLMRFNTKQIINALQ